ncbi:MAG TPA: S26 family signal peptidase [Phycisphaerae bacterium]|nr:S26 family signal peptidase [Phycisphaerae bacterium]HRY71109.1 S26 family signal peptidase [Phycisphaerae bacterium]
MARQAQTVSSPSPAAKSVTETIRETLESIVVAFVLAFVFRAFVVEAFVIPTGSMAVTLYGDQATNTCSACGYEYARGITQTDVAEAIQRRVYNNRLRCPNCDTEVDRIPMARLQRPDSGDRILVQKWGWSLGLGGKHFGPNRWDVTVFKDPKDGTTNFIKRLVGLPGEVLEIIDGDVYTVSVGELQGKEPGVVEALDELRREVYFYGIKSGPAASFEQIHNRYTELNQRILPHLRIARKTELAQESLWCNVYDHDYLPAAVDHARPASTVGWRPVGDAAAKVWTTSGRELVCECSEDTLQAIQFDGKVIGDLVTYNDSGRYGRGPRGGTFLVGDVRLRFTWFPIAGNGGLRLQMNKDRDLFIADIGADGVVAIEQQGPGLPGGKRVVGQAKISRPLRSGRAVKIEFANVDFRVSLRVDGKELVTTGDEYQPDIARAVQVSLRKVDDVRPTAVQIAARNLHSRFRHVVVERDVYYQSTPQIEHDNDKGQTNPHVGWPAWGTTGHPILLREGRDVNGRHYSGEYFMLGDNSPASKDSRLWWEVGPHLKPLGEEYQLGTVPGDQLIGRAFFVYWPAGYRSSWAAGLGVIPNFGRMRWIR